MILAVRSTHFNVFIIHNGEKKKALSSLPVKISAWASSGRDTWSKVQRRLGETLYLRLQTCRGSSGASERVLCKSQSMHACVPLCPCPALSQPKDRTHPSSVITSLPSTALQPPPLCCSPRSCRKETRTVKCNTYLKEKHWKKDKRNG